MCRLWPDEAVTLGFGLGEGIESALSLAHALTPVWAAIDAGNLGAFPVLEGVEGITVAVDHEPVGSKAARELAQRWRASGRQVRLVMADQFGADINDIVRAA